MMPQPTTIPPPASQPTSAPGPAPGVRVPSPPKHILTFYTHVGYVLRDDLNSLTAEPDSVRLPVVRLGIGFGGVVYSGLHLDMTVPRIELYSMSGDTVAVPLGALSLEELAAVRFIDAALHTRDFRPSPAWKASVVQTLGEMVPLFDLDEDPVDPKEAVAFFNRHVVLN